MLRYQCYEQRAQFTFSGYSPKLALQWRRDDELWNKIILFFSYLKKYSCSFITFRLNHWWQMDYFNDVFHTFLCLDCVIYLAVNGTVTRLPVFIQNMLHYYYYYNLYLTRKEKFTEITISFAGVTWPRWAAQVYKYITNNNNTINNKIR